MKLYTLTINDVDGKSAEFNLKSEAGIKNADDALRYLEDVLFGNDALFAGEIELSATLGGKDYLIRRDFSADVEVFYQGESLPKEKAEAVIYGIAALTRKQWKENTAPCDADSFEKDTASYVGSFLSALGFDKEDLEQKGAGCEKQIALTIAQVEALDELVLKKDVISAADEKRAEVENLKSEINKLNNHKKLYEENNARIEKRDALTAELNAAKDAEPQFVEIAEKLAVGEKLVEDIRVYDRINELERENAALQEELVSLTGELDFAEKEIAKEEESLKGKEDNYSYYNERVISLRDDFDKMLANNAEKGEVTAAAMGKIATSDEDERAKALASYNEWNARLSELREKFDSVKLNYLKRRSVREGVAFETTLDDKRDRLNVMESMIDAQKAMIARLEKEIADSEMLLADNGGAKLSDSDAKRMKLFKNKILCQTLNVDIGAAEQKIRANEDARKSYAEDIDALTKAKTALNEYVARCEERRNKINDKLIGIKGRLSICKDVDAMEFGSVCPVCKGRVTDKAELALEHSRLSASFTKYEEELNTNRSILKEYGEKLEKLNTRLGQLNERDRLCSVYIDSLKSSVSAKQTALNGLLKDVGVVSLPALEKQFDEADAVFTRESGAGGADGAFLHEHIRFLKGQVEEINARIAPLTDEAENLRRDIADMNGAYEEAIAPELDGRRAYDYLEEIVSDEKTEDELFELIKEAEVKREQYLTYLLNEGNSNGTPEEIVTAAAEFFLEVSAEIRRNEDLRQKALEEKAEVLALINKKKDALNELAKKAEELIFKTESNTKCATELLSTHDLPEIDENTLVTLKNSVLPEEEKQAFISQIENYHSEMGTLSLRIDALSAEITDVEFDSDRYDALLNESLKAEKELEELNNVLTVSAAAENSAREKADKCALLAKRADELKKLADGEITEVVLPVLNDALAIIGEDANAAADGLGIKYTVTDRKGSHTLDHAEMKPDGLSVALNCTLNYLVRLASGRETTRFAKVDKITDNLANAADKYGVILL